MNPNQRDNYLKALQIETWVPRVNLPNAAESKIITTTKNNVTPSIIENSSQKEIITNLADNLNKPAIEEKKKIASAHLNQKIENKIEQNITTDDAPSFSLQLMKAGSCLLLIELSQGEALQINDKSYQLLRNILRAAQLSDSPEWLGDIIHWPLFKQTSIPQGKHEANEFLQSFIKTHQEQLNDINWLWLIGDAAINYTIPLQHINYYQIVTDQTLGKSLLIPALDILLNTPDNKAKLWQSIRLMIPSWKK